MIVGPLNRRIRILRRLEAAGPRTINIDPLPSAPMAAHFSTPESGEDTGSPRLVEDKIPVFIPFSNLARRRTENLIAGSRIEDTVSATTYELVADPEPIKSGFVTVYERFLVVEIAKLYPWIGTITDQKGVALDEDVRLAMWETSETQEERGHYGVMSGEIPAEHVAAAETSNARIEIGTEVYRINTVLRQRGGAWAELTLRIPNG